MIKIRRSYITNVAGLGDAETQVHDINYRAPITAIDIKVQMTTGAGGGSALPVPIEVPNISIVDGAFTLFSMLMATMVGLLWALVGAKPQLHHEQGITKVNEAYGRILFGRYYGDREYYLDATMWRNLQLRITSAFTIAAASYVTGLGTVTIIVHTIEDGALGRKGTFISKEISAPTLAANAAQFVDLPVDYPYAQLTFFGTDGTVDPDLCCSDVKLSVDNDSDIIFDHKTVDVIHDNLMEHGAFDVNNDEFLNLAVGLNIGLTDTVEFLRYMTPFGAFWLSLGVIQDGEFYNPNPNSTNRLTLTGGATGGKTRAVLTQVMP